MRTWSGVGLLAAACLCGSVSASAVDHWPQFLGPTGDGRADDAKLPVQWTETEHVKWNTPIHGRGWSSPVIWGGQIWMTTASEEGRQLSVVCVDQASGKILHDFKLFDEETPQDIHKFNSYASPTPAIEAGRVYVTFGHSGTACLDTATAKVLWQRRDLPCFHFRGAGSSPVLYGDLLYLHYDGFDYQYIAALNKSTGETVWKTDRNVDYGTDNGDFKKAFCTPRVFEIDGRPQLISPTSKAALSYDPFTGKELWRVRYNGFSCAIPPMFAHGMVYINTGFGKADVYAVKANSLSGDVTDTHVIWKQSKNMPSKPAQLIVGDEMYVVHDGGTAACLDAKTGDVVWQHRLGGNFSASPIFANGRIYAFSEEGPVTVFEAAREYRELAVNKLPEGALSSPAVAGHALYLRTRTALYRIED